MCDLLFIKRKKRNNNQQTNTRNKKGNENSFTEIARGVWWSSRRASSQLLAPHGSINNRPVGPAELHECEASLPREELSHQEHSQHKPNETKTDSKIETSTASIERQRERIEDRGSRERESARAREL